MSQIALDPLLDKQKVLRKKRRGFAAYLSFFALLALALALFLAKKHLAYKMENLALFPKLALQIGSDDLSQKNKELLYSFIQEKKDSPLLPKEEIAKLALDLFSTSHLAKISIIALPGQKTTLFVQTKPRSAEVCVLADKLRLLSQDGLIYGECLDALKQKKITGIFAANESFEYLPADNKLKIEEGKEILLEEAVRAMDLLKNEHLDFSTLEFDSNIGFKVELLNRKILVTLGRAPFSSKIKRLKAILQKDDPLLYEIDLDYEDKAFLLTKDYEKKSDA